MLSARGRFKPTWVDGQGEAKDDGAFADEDGARAWLATYRDAIMTETTRRMQKAQAASEKKKAAMDLVLKARQEEQKAAARAAKAAVLATAISRDMRHKRSG